MKIFKLPYIFGIIIFLSGFIYAEIINNEVDEDEDQFYLIYVNNRYGEIPIFSNDNSNSKLKKRQESVNFVESLIGQIEDLIVNNKNTYQDPAKLDEIEKESQLRKRDNKLVNDNWDSNLIYPISSVGDTTVLFGYLSKPLAESIRRMKNIIDCAPDRQGSNNSYYDIEEIKAETHWKDVTVRENADFHLSLISQGTYHNETSKYDNNYYYPSSGGKDIDIIVIDSAFNFNYYEFSNTNEREIKCVTNIRQGRPEVSEELKCGSDPTVYHGNKVSDTAGGLKHGVAPKANIYAITHSEKINFSDIIGGLQYIKENMIRPHKTVINISSAYTSFVGDPDTADVILYRQLAKEISDLGAVIVTCAGNDGFKIGEFVNVNPCMFDDVICVGGVDNDRNNNVTYYDIARKSNYGDGVDFYAPFNVTVSFLNKKEKLIENNETAGTSFSTPIVSGIIASIMGEFPQRNFTTKEIINYLYELSEPVISNRHIGFYYLFVNNGKHTVYSEDGIYPGCSDNQPCLPTSTLKKQPYTKRKTTTTRALTTTTVMGKKKITRTTTATATATEASKDKSSGSERKIQLTSWISLLLISLLMII